MNRNFNKEVTLVIKGIVVLMMVCHHLFSYPEWYAGYNISFSIFEEYRINNLFKFFKLCVGTFAFISGYGLSAKWNHMKNTTSMKEFYTNQYVNSMSSYWFVFIISLVICQLIDGSTKEIYFSNEIIVNIFNLVASFLGFGILLGIKQLVHEWWYMGACAIFICLIPLLTDFIKKHGYFPAIILIFCLPRLLGVKFLGGTAPWSFMMPVTLGIIFQEYEMLDRDGVVFEKYKNIFGRILDFIILVCTSYFAYKMYTQLPFDQFYELKYSLPPIIAILFCKEFIYPINFFRVIFKFFGKHSVNIYLVHTIILKYCKNFILEQPNFIISCSILILLSVMVSVCLDGIKKVIRYEKIIVIINRLLNGTFNKKEVDR